MANFAAVSGTVLVGCKVPLKDILAKGQIPEWPNGADCKSAGVRLRWFESIFAHTRNGFAEIAQLIEH